MLQNMKLKRITAWMAMTAVLFVMLFSVIYISQHADHECTGAECPVCAVMAQCGDNIKVLGTAVAVLVAAVFLGLSIQKRVQYVITVYSDCSLISQKIRMNN